MGFNRILALKLRSMGDTVVMTAALSELRSAFPRAEIHVAVTDSWLPLLEKHPAIDRTWAYTRYLDPASRAKAIASLALKLRRFHFDCVLNFHASPSSAVLAFATGAKTRSIHFHGHRDKNRYSTVQIPGKGTVKPIVERDMDAVRALGIDVPEGRLPALFLSESEKEHAGSVLQEEGFNGPILAIAVGASRPTKVWPMERFAKVAQEWASKTGGGVVAIGAGQLEKEMIADLLQRIPPSVRVRSFSDCSVRDLAAILSNCKVVVGNDSGPRHLAAAVGRPTVTLIGPEHPLEWHPYPQEKHPYLYLDGLACRRDAMPGMPSWCGLSECIEEKHRCMLGISHERVVAEVFRVAGV